jgi:TonB-dependent starch-binding outer membrane protein SusC
MKAKLFLLTLIVALVASGAYGQKSAKKISVTGIVRDSYQSPVHGAEIMVDGERSGIYTDKKGAYKIKVKVSDKKIGIYTPPPSVMQEAIAGRNSIDFILNDSIVKLINRASTAYEDELIDVGYGTQKRKNLTTSVSKVDARQARYASYNSIYDLIRSEVPGVTVSGTSILIREPSSLEGSNEPLFVVDGVPVTSIDGIQPQMVRSISVLKGSAASIYGTRGANGAILISTTDRKK